MRGFESDAISDLMGERKLASIKAVAAACQESIGTVVETLDEAMRVQTALTFIRPGSVNSPSPFLWTEARTVASSATRKAFAALGSRPA